MSKIVRKKHLNIIELLTKATDAIAGLIKDDRVQECLILLADCQESAVVLGGHIEKLYGMDTQSVPALEQYCECLYQLSVILDENTQNGMVYQALKEATDNIKETYEKEFPDKKEVVFLPYNASMWDSLESVWMAARDDEECEAYVIPIPYYDLDGNHNFKEMHYEGDLYPSYVPITSYEEYDLEERHPDMIYIHNPYDQYNRVTSIDPRFYSSKIKDYTEKLVYIPYFVLQEVDPKNEKVVEQIKHFILTPGVINADEVIVQSEAMKQVYEKVLLDYFGDTSKNRDIFKRKIVGSGSPKIEKIRNTKKESIVVPSEWLQIIKKSDGSWKKIVFYNTSVASLLVNGDKYIDKLTNTLKVFKDNKEAVALLWRPHPLMIQTLQSMRPELLGLYKETVEVYKSEGWGIYDDTSDLDRAIILSDGYYGDQSSIRMLFEARGVPIMIQDVRNFY